MRRHRQRLVVLGTLAAMFAPHIGASAADQTLAETLAKMDQFASNFRSLSADISRVSHMDVLHEDTVDKGTIQVKRPKPKDLHVRIEVSEPNPQVAVVSGTKVEIYYPRSGEIQRYDVGHEKSLVDQLLALGFGGNSRELLSAYSVKLGGPETIEGQKTTRLELTPKTQDMGTRTKRIDLWISDQAGYTVQQKFFQPANDYSEFTYTNVKTNPPISDSVFELKVPKGTKRDTPIKR